MGLTLVERIVRDGGGIVWVESQGRGTTVRFTIVEAREARPETRP